MGMALILENDGDQVSLPLVQSDSVFTVEAWVNIGLNYSKWRTIYAGSRGFWLKNRPLNWWQNGYDIFIGKTEIPSQEWHHIALTYNNSIITGYLDGIVDSTTTNPDAILPLIGVGIGGAQ